MKSARSPRERLLWILLFLLCALLAGHAFLYDYVVDDAFISFRYARNLIHGEGLVFNPGERVEGYTNFLWVILMALGLGLGADPVRLSQTLGLLSGAAVVILLFVWPRPGVRGRDWLRLVAPALLCLAPSFALWSVGGLETSLFTLLVYAAMLANAHGAESRGSKSGDAVCGLCLGLATLTRPEGWLAAILIVADRAAGGRPPRAGSDVHPRAAGRFPVILLIVWLAVVAPYEIWRWTYYGDLLPNSYHAKVGWTLDQAVRGLEYLGRFIAAFGWPAVLLAALGAARSLREPALRLPLLWLLFYTAYVVAVGGDGLAMYRFFVPVLPALYLLAENGIRVLGGRIRHRSPGRVRAAAVALCLVLGLVTVRPTFASREKEFVERDKQFVMHWTMIGQWLRSYARPGDSIAVTTAGAVPYYSGLYTIDMLGINEREIAHRKVAGMGRGIAGHEKYDMAYVVRRRPTYLFHHLFLLTRPKFSRDQFETPWNPGEEALLTDPEFARLYEPVTEKVGDFYLNFFRLRGTAEGGAE